MKNIKQYILQVAIFLFLIAGVVSAGITGGIGGPTLWYLDGTTLRPVDPTWNIEYGILTVSEGGTGLTTTTRGALLVGTSTTAYYAMATGTEGYVLKISSGMPAWGVTTYTETDPIWLVASSTYLATTTAASTYVARSTWTTIDNYPSACSNNGVVYGIGDTLSCYSTSTLYTNLGITGSTPAGSDTQVQFNNGGFFGGDTNFTWTTSTQTLALAATDIPSYINSGGILNINSGGDGEAINLQTSAGTSLGSSGGVINLLVGDAQETADGGSLILRAGRGGTTSTTAGGNVGIQGGITWNGSYGSGYGGDVILEGGTKMGTGVTIGQVKIKYNNYYAVFDPSLIASSDKTFTFPNNSGTLALTSDILASSITTFAIRNATSTGNPVAQHKYPTAITITRISCSGSQSTTTIQFDERSEATPNTAGTDVLSAALGCGSSTTTASTAFANAGIAANAILSLDIDAMTGGSTTTVNIHVEYTIDD